MSDQPEIADVDESSPLEGYASDLAERLGASGYHVAFDTVRIFVENDRWVDTIVSAREELPLFSWLSAIDWSKTTEVGEGVELPDELEERFEIICRLSSVTNADAANFVTAIDKTDPVITSLAPSIGGAAWHEREAHDMFGINFEGNDNLEPLYLPDDFLGNPLLKSYPLITREVKPWPGAVDVEGMPADDADTPDGGTS